ncbi:hypothetical protein WUBG_12972, partial [Wuchereria bancrofti]
NELIVIQMRSAILMERLLGGDDRRDADVGQWWSTTKTRKVKRKLKKEKLNKQLKRETKRKMKKRAMNEKGN